MGQILHKRARTTEEVRREIRLSKESLIKTAKRLGKKVGICGQGPSDFPDFAH